MKDVCHRYHLVEHIYPHYKTVYPNEISALLRLFYQKRFKEIDIFYILNQCDGDAERICAAKSILKACNFNGCYGSIIEQ